MGRKRIKALAKIMVGIVLAKANLSTSYYPAINQGAVIRLDLKPI
jgi:hypothetical protein